MQPSGVCWHEEMEEMKHCDEDVLSSNPYPTRRIPHGGGHLIRHHSFSLTYQLAHRLCRQPTGMGFHQIVTSGVFSFCCCMLCAVLCHSIWQYKCYIHPSPSSMRPAGCSLFCLPACTCDHVFPTLSNSADCSLTHAHTSQRQLTERSQQALKIRVC